MDPAQPSIAAPPPFLLEGIGQRRDVLFINYEALWAKLRSLEWTLALVQADGGSTDPKKETVLAQCRKNLSEAMNCLKRRKKVFRRPTNPDLFWRLAHQIDENLLLIMPRPMLAAAAREVEGVFRRNISDKTLRESWLGKDETSGPLCKAVERLTRSSSNADQADLDIEDPADRNMLQSALRAVNERADRQFRQIATNTLFQVLSA